MKKYFLLGLMIAIAPNICFGAGARYTQLVREKQRKMEELEKCMGATNGLKIAGLSTIGLTAVGVAGNVVQAKKLDEYESGIESKQKELEKVNKDIAEKQAEIKKAKEAEEAAAAAAAQKKAEEEARALYQTNCLKTGGSINENGTCICPDNSSLNEGGFCKKQMEIVSVNPNIAGQELKGVDANNLYTWNSGSTNWGQDSTLPNQQNNNSLTGKTGTSATSNGDKTAKPEDKSVTQNNSTNQKPLEKNAPKTMSDNQSSGTEKESGPTPIIKTNEPVFVPKDPVTPVDKTYVAPKAVIDTKQPASSGSSSKTNHIDNDHCESLRASGKFKTVTTMSDGRCKVECPYGKYLDVVHKICESMYDVPGNTQRDASGIIYPKQTSTATNSGNNNKPATTQSLIKETQTTTQPRKNEQIITEGVTKANKQADLLEGEEVCWKKLTSYEGVEKVMMMLNGDCQIQCKNGYNFNTLRKACESKLMTPMGSKGYIK